MVVDSVGVQEEEIVIVQALCARTSPLWDAATGRCRPLHHRRSPTITSPPQQNINPQFLGHVDVPIVQALPAFVIDNHYLPPPPPPLIAEDTSPKPKMKKRRIKSIPAFTLTTAVDRRRPPKPSAAAASSSRSTRSRAVPDWSPHETLILLNEIASLDDHWVKSLSWYQKWNMIAENCSHFGVLRSSTHCKLKWDSLLADYKMIIKWESDKLGPYSYWVLHHDQRIQLGLPPSYDRQVFDAMAVFAITLPEEENAARPSLPSTTCTPRAISDASLPTLLHADNNSGSGVKACEEAEKNVEKGLELQLLTGDNDADNQNDENESKMLDMCTDSGSEEEGDSRDESSPSRGVEIASKLEETAQKIHEILEAEVDENAGKQAALMDLEKINNADIELASRRADDLIKILGHFADSIDEFSELIKESKRERTRPIRPLEL